MIPLVALLACTGASLDDGETAPDEDTQGDDAAGATCKKAEIRVDGDDPPTVGDQWTIFLWCDDTLLLGAMVLRFDPGEVAKLDENVATFVAAGDSTLTVQVGRYEAARTVSVGE